MSSTRPLPEMLRYRDNPPGADTVRRYYKRDRQENNIPAERCDNPKCVFHTQPLTWNNECLQMILDHIDGCRKNNDPSNLRVPMPQPRSQLKTRGGRNRGRVQNVGEFGYSIVETGSEDKHCKVFDGGTL